MQTPSAHTTTLPTGAETHSQPVANNMALPDCAGGESFALMVHGQSMVPEFQEGEIILIEPEGLAKEGAYVLAWHQDEWTFRQLLRNTEGWLLHALNPAFADEKLADLSAIKGVIIQKALPGRRRASKFYV
ncbi:S24 family peptidase [Rhodoferax lithotrophicus]|nr:S24 family peptidase [Rhodoferax sp. MIZ03]